MVAEMPPPRIRDEADRWQDGRHQRTGLPFARLRLAGVGLVALAIFALDTFTTMSSAIAILYVLVLVAVSDSRTRKELWWLCAGCVGLTLASFLSDHSLTEDTGATLRMSFCVIAMATVTFLLVRNLETRQRYEAQAMLLDATADAIVLRDLRGLVLLWNHGAEILYGLPRDGMIGRVHHEVLRSDFPAPLAAIEQVLHETDAWNGEIRQIGEDGRILTVTSRWTLQRDRRQKAWAVLETSTDITEHKRMADDLARMRSDLEHAMRVTTIGEVSATIAHEVNQPLAAIRTYAEAAQRWIGRGSEKDALVALQEIASAAGHAGDIIKGMRRLLSRSAREDLPIVIDDMIVDAMRLVRREILDSHTEMMLDLASESAEVSGDRLLLQQAIVNLVTNAIQAMHDMPTPGSLRISTRLEDGMIVVTVRDYGPGFSDDIIAEALNAFASTRSGGMGLGLAICRSAVEAHGGYVRIGNITSGGAQVLLGLPKIA